MTFIHKYILDTYVALSGEGIKNKVVKLDVFIINDKEVDGSFAPGALILNEETVKELNTNYRCCYLIARGLLGMVRLASQKNVLNLN